MFCYQCGSVLGSGKYCLRCGADVSAYRKVVRLSNSYYNIGLEKARVRDLTGAAEALSRALALDKRNTEARNLLGLVMNEMGETAEALCCWTVSTTFDSRNNPASAYIDALKKDQIAYEQAAMALQKYNLGLEYARQGSEDLAAIQLQRVIQLNPKMLKAHALLALLEFWDDRFDKAEKECRQALKLDRGNTFCGNMLKEIAARKSELKEKGLLRARREALAEGVVKAEPENRKLSGTAAFWLRFGLGMLLIILLFVGILNPTVRRRRSRLASELSAEYAVRTQEINEMRVRLENDIDVLNREIDALNQELADREQDIADRDEIISRHTDVETEIAKYETVLTMFRLDPQRDREALLAIFNTLKEDKIDSEGYRAVYAYWRKALGFESPTEAPQG